MYFDLQRLRNPMNKVDGTDDHEVACASDGCVMLCGHKHADVGTVYVSFTMHQKVHGTKKKFGRARTTSSGTHLPVTSFIDARTWSNFPRTTKITVLVYRCAVTFAWRWSLHCPVLEQAAAAVLLCCCCCCRRCDCCGANHLVGAIVFRRKTTFSRCLNSNSLLSVRYQIYLTLQNEFPQEVRKGFGRRNPWSRPLYVWRWSWYRYVIIC